MDDHQLTELLLDTVAAIRTALAGFDAWRERGERAGQYRLDLVADAAALTVLRRADVGVLSEESGLEGADREIVVVIDPVDGSTNASRGLPWYAASLCAVDADGPRVAVVENLATGTRYQAVRGDGAWRDGRPIAVSAATRLSESMVAVNGLPAFHAGWRQFRAMGAAALDLCAVAEGAVDGYLDCTESQHGTWDYLGALLIVAEAGGVVTDLWDRQLVVLDPAARRTPVAAASESLHRELLIARRAFGEASAAPGGESGRG